jgi:hypothetical protein
MSFVNALSRMIRCPVVSRGNARRSSGRSLLYRPSLERLEDRLPPGDWLLGAVWGSSLLGPGLLAGTSNPWAPEKVLVDGHPAEHRAAPLGKGAAGEADGSTSAPAFRAAQRETQDSTAPATQAHALVEQDTDGPWVKR